MPESFSADEKTEAERLIAESNAALAAMDVDSFAEKRQRESELGSFKPWLEEPRGEDGRPFRVSELVANDRAFFVDLFRAMSILAMRKLEVPRNAPITFRTINTTYATVGFYLGEHEPHRPYISPKTE